MTVMCLGATDTSPELVDDDGNLTLQALSILLFAEHTATDDSYGDDSPELEPDNTELDQLEATVDSILLTDDELDAILDNC